MSSELESATEQVSVAPKHLKLVQPATTTKQKTERVVYRPATIDPDLEWLIQSGDSALGAKGTLAGVISQIERGSVGGNGTLDGAGSYIHPYTDAQLALGGKTGIGEVERHRWLIAAWRELSFEMRRVLWTRYHAPRAEFRSDGGYGARDRWVEGSDSRPGHHENTRTGIESLLGEFSGLCVALCPDPAKLLLACHEPDPQLRKKDGAAVVNKDGTVLINRSLQAERRALRGSMLKLARAADTEAHERWAAAKAQVAGVRSLTDRVGIRPPKTAELVAFADTPAATERPTRLVDDAAFGEAVRVALEASGRLPQPSRPRLVQVAK